MTQRSVEDRRIVNPPPSDSALEGLPFQSRSRNLVVYCADIGSVPRGRFGWARLEAERHAHVEEHRGSAEVVKLVDALVADLAASRPVALGFECPLFVPVPADSTRLGAARRGEGNRSGSARAGAGALATGLVEIAWVLSAVRDRVRTPAHVTWDQFAAGGRGLFLWEAFVTDTAKAATHEADAAIAVGAFLAALPDPTRANAVDAERPLSLLGAALLWSGWSEDDAVLREPCLVIKAAPRGDLVRA